MRCRKCDIFQVLFLAFRSSTNLALIAGEYAARAVFMKLLYVFFFPKQEHF